MKNGVLKKHKILRSVAPIVATGCCSVLFATALVGGAISAVKYDVESKKIENEFSKSSTYMEYVKTREDYLTSRFKEGASTYEEYREGMKDLESSESVRRYLREFADDETKEKHKEAFAKSDVGQLIIMPSAFGAAVSIAAMGNCIKNKDSFVGEDEFER